MAIDEFHPSAAHADARELPVERLTREAFAPFGDVIELDGARHYPINLGTTERYHDLAYVDTADEGGRTLINVFRGQPRALPFELTMMERHPLGSQAFVPLHRRPYLVVVAPAGDLDPHALRAFVARDGQGVNFAKGVWHHPLIACGEVSDFMVVDRGGGGVNLNEETLPFSRVLPANALTISD
ncbi:MAG TPA: ureidoglycolate lyase [Pararobbsia sp.]|jgi:ureidoglycolate lyase|nr:ureidoglycolate lyase [Pararobbsia sp.]